MNPTSNYRPNIKFNAASANGGEPTELVVPFSIQVENGVEIGGMIMENTTLYPDVHYIVSSNLAVPSGVTLTIKPGTIIRIKDDMGIAVSGHLNAVGNADSLIVFTKTDLGNGRMATFTFPNDTLQYVVFENLKVNKPGHSTQLFYGSPILKNCIIRNMESEHAGMRAIFSNIIDNRISQPERTNTGGLDRINGTSLNIVDNKGLTMPVYNTLFKYEYKDNSNIFNNEMAVSGSMSRYVSVGEYLTSPTIINNGTHNYLGTAREDIAHDRIVDELDVRIFWLCGC